MATAEDVIKDAEGAAATVATPQRRRRTGSTGRSRRRQTPSRGCDATTKAGRPCKWPAQTGMKQCYQHDPAKEEERDRVRKAGASKGGKTTAELIREGVIRPPVTTDKRRPRNPRDWLLSRERVLGELGRVIDRVETGELRANEGQTVVAACRVALESIRQEPQLEARYKFKIKRDKGRKQDHEDSKRKAAETATPVKPLASTRRVDTPPLEELRKTEVTLEGAMSLFTEEVEEERELIVRGTAAEVKELTKDVGLTGGGSSLASPEMPNVEVPGGEGSSV